MNTHSLTPSGSLGRLKGPSSGVVSSNLPRGWIGKAWGAIFKPLARTHHAQIARGRTIAKSGRVRDLGFGPGSVFATVVGNKHENRVSIRVQPLDDDQWDQVVQVLVSNLQLIASLLEDELPRELIAQTKALGVLLLPQLADLDGDCDCQDFRLPCEHMSAVHQVLADALDGDPFLLLTLRGRTRDQLLAALRASWNDSLPVFVAEQQPSEPAPQGDWFTIQSPLPKNRLQLAYQRGEAVGLRALGPPPGQVDLVPILAPLYASGAEAAYQLAIQNNDSPAQTEAHPSWAELKNAVPTPKVRPTPPEAASKTRTIPTPPKPEPPSPPSQDELVERIVSNLYESDFVQAADLAERFRVPILDVRGVLLELERLGIVYRTGQTRATRWWLG